MKDGAASDNDCCGDGESQGGKIHLNRLTVAKKGIIHFDKSEKKLVRLLPAIADEEEQKLMVAEILQMGVFASWFRSLSMIGLFSIMSMHMC